VPRALCPLQSEPPHLQRVPLVLRDVTPSQAPRCASPAPEARTLSPLELLLARFALPARTPLSSLQHQSPLALRVQLVRTLWQVLQLAPSVSQDIMLRQQAQPLQAHAQYAQLEHTLH
jgi:hypothetical protein